jgi:hypothetical protein
MQNLGKPKSLAAWDPHSTLNGLSLHCWAASVAKFAEPLIQLHLNDAESLSFSELIALIRCAKLRAPTALYSFLVSLNFFPATK